MKYISPLVIHNYKFIRDENRSRVPIRYLNSVNNYIDYLK